MITSWLITAHWVKSRYACPNSCGLTKLRLDLAIQLVRKIEHIFGNVVPLFLRA